MYISSNLTGSPIASVVYSRWVDLSVTIFNRTDLQILVYN
jgi:hypothetical protein